MTAPSHQDQEFLNRITSVLEEHLEDSRFGVSELAREVGMSRSNLLRKVTRLTGKSVSQFIREVRLKKAMNLLKEGSHNVSEVSYLVGFSSVSYFIKCFREQYGFPPGETSNQAMSEDDPVRESPSGRRPWRKYYIVVAALLVAIAVIWLLVNPFSARGESLEKSIAVLPFQNDSNDSTNLYLINGIMESLLNDLQQIEDLRVVSRTSVEKYRTQPSTIAEIARELDVNYVVEGSGQKIGDQILLHIQLIEAPTDQHIWSKQFKRQVQDIFTLQMELAQGIADGIKAVITPAEEQRINRPPTENLEAYDLFLQGMEQFNERTREGLLASIDLFKQAIEQDGEFARAYADISIAYSFLDWSQVEKQYTDLAVEYADKALLYDPELSQSLIAKAAVHMNSNEPILALPFLEKALEYNPNSATVINILSEFYTNYVPDTDKYLEYALKGIKLDIGAHDSADASYIFMHLSNALLQAGFISQAETYIERSLSYNPDNLYSAYLRAYIQFARDGDLEETRLQLENTLSRDPTRLDILQEVGKICYFMRDYQGALHYYERFLELKSGQQVVAFRGEDAKIGLVYSEAGMTEKADSLFNAYKIYADSDLTMYKHLSLAVYDAHFGELKQSLEHLELFSQQNSFSYLLFKFMEIDPLTDALRELPTYKEIIQKMEEKFWADHERIRRSLAEKKLI
ncbi:MAG: helix-turn-helix domain-containing protein [Bacteroidales bacterium]